MPMISQGRKWASEPRDFLHKGTWQSGGKGPCGVAPLPSPGFKRAGADLLPETCLASLSGGEERKSADCWLKKKDELHLNLSHVQQSPHPPPADCLLFRLQTTGLFAEPDIGLRAPGAAARVHPVTQVVHSHHSCEGPKRRPEIGLVRDHSKWMLETVTCHPAAGRSQMSSPESPKLQPWSITRAEIELSGTFSLIHYSLGEKDSHPPWV